jgi:hypothetical protein
MLSSLSKQENVPQLQRQRQNKPHIIHKPRGSSQAASLYHTPQQHSSAQLKLAV